MRPNFSPTDLLDVLFYFITLRLYLLQYNGPLDQYKVTLEQLQQRISGQNASASLRKFRKDEITELLLRMEKPEQLDTYCIANGPFVSRHCCALF